MWRASLRFSPPYGTIFSPSQGGEGNEKNKKNKKALPSQGFGKVDISEIGKTLYGLVCRAIMVLSEAVR